MFLINKLKLLSSDKLVVFIVLIVSSVGFSVGLVLAKVLGDETIVTKIVNFQSIVVFFSFILQLGTRSALRLHYYKNRQRLVALVEQSLYVFLILVCFLGGAYELYTGNIAYIIFSSTLAFVTLKLTLTIARNDFRGQVLYTIQNLILCVSGSIFYLIEPFLFSADVMLETSSLLILVLNYHKIKYTLIYKKRRSLASIFLTAQSYQLGSGVIAIMVFVLVQGALLKYSNTDVMLAFADIQIAAGFIVLLMGQALLVCERRLYKEQQIKFKVFCIMLMLQTIITCGIASVLYGIYGGDVFLLFVLSFLLSSRVVLGYIVQYVSSNNSRRSMNKFFIIVLGLYATYFYNFMHLPVVVQLFPVLFFILLGFILISRECKYAK
jgi:hypothetical protein